VVQYVNGHLIPSVVKYVVGRHFCSSYLHQLYIVHVFVLSLFVIYEPLI
jgi:hypothetical protein